MQSESPSCTAVGKDPRKRTSSSIMDNPIWGKSINFGPVYVSDVATHLRSNDEDYDEHISRRRRLSSQPLCSAEDHCAFVGVGNEKDARCAKSSQCIQDIRRTLGRTTSELELPDPKENISPDEFMMKLVKVTCNLELEAKKARSLEGFFCSVSDEQMAAYTMKVVAAVRSNDLESLKALHSDGQILNCFNRFGESLLTMACRRGFEDIVEYLLNQSDIDIRISDDSGRTVLHDACWHPSPQLNICRWILEREPALFFILDNRGCSAFHYARPEHWGIWRQFLFDNRESLSSLKREEILVKLAKFN